LIVLDSWALLAFLKEEPAAGRVEAEWVAEGAAISSINLGEVLYIRMGAAGEGVAREDVNEIRSRLTVLDPSWETVEIAATIKAGGGLSFADAFCMATAAQLNVPLLTGDPEIVERATQLDCEIVDLR
jgi:PIN domain nuclease of toxin-antitoxin system